MMSLSIRESRCSISFSSGVECDTFVRRVRRARLRVDWHDQAHCIVQASAMGNVLRLLAQDGPVVLEVDAAGVDEQASGSGKSSRPEQGAQLRLL